MRPILSAEEEKINWVNYKTGIRYISFRMHADKGAFIAIDISHPDATDRQVYFEKFRQLKSVFLETMGEAWEWNEDREDENGKSISRIHTELTGVNIYNKADWPTLISFFKPRMIALDKFWTLVKPGFET